MWKIAFSFFFVLDSTGYTTQCRAIGVPFHDSHPANMIYCFVFCCYSSFYARWESTATSRTRTLEQMIQRRNELGKYIAAINLNAITKISLSLSSSLVLSTNTYYTVVEISCTYSLFLQTPLRLVHHSLYRSMVIESKRAFHTSFYNQVLHINIEYSASVASENSFCSEWDYKSLLWDRSYYFYHFFLNKRPDEMHNSHQL